MQFSITPTLEGQPIVEYCGVVISEARLGTHAIKGIDIDDETPANRLLTVSVSATAVKTR